MSQWGREKVVNGALFVPHVHSEPFQPITEDSPIDFVMLLDDGGDRKKAMNTSVELSQVYSGKLYKEWLELTPHTAC